MYPHPDLVRSNRVIIRLNQHELELLQQQAIQRGIQLATLVRWNALSQAQKDLEPEVNISAVSPPVEDTKQQL